MERTISAMIGKGSVNHNTRAFTAKNVDKNRSADNVEFCQEDIKQVYHKLFDEALERYNVKQKRKDRMIDNYYEKIRRGKQEKLYGFNYWHICWNLYVKFTEPENMH